MSASFVWASLRGVDSHGIGRAPRYLEMFDSGVANRTPAMTETSTRPGVVRIDADYAPGPVALSRAADVAVERARANGVAWVAVHETVHAGAIGAYAERVAEAGMVGLVMVAGMPNMTYHGSVGPGVATSPLAIAVPGTGAHPPVLLDMATAVIAFGKIAQAQKRGETLPENSAVTADGVVTTDPALAKFPLPLGGPKGAGMSLVFELLTSVLVSAPILTGFHSSAEGGKRHRQNAAIIAIDPAAVTDPAVFAADVDATIIAIQGLPPASGGDAVTVPGQRSAATAEARRAAGIPVRDDLRDEFVAAATQLGVAIPAELA
jgi:ureidoglycolate dehydrogenase (NAD+)